MNYFFLGDGDRSAAALPGENDSKPTSKQFRLCEFRQIFQRQKIELSLSEFVFCWWGEFFDFLLHAKRLQAIAIFFALSIAH
jgi:hypothetical protein